MLNNMNKALISIIVPVYNSEKYINRCVNSLIKQTYKNLEIILVDDGSTDTSPQICDRFKEQDDRVKVIHKPNGGVSSARNEGLSLASGDYIGFVDSDDWIAVNMYEILYDVIKKNGTQIAAGQMIRTPGQSEGAVVNTEKGRVTVYNREDYARKFFKLDGNETVFYIWNKLFEKKVAKKMIFPENVHIAEDTEAFYFALKNVESIAETDAVIYNYFYRKDSAAATWFSPKHMGIITAWKDILNDTQTGGNESWKEYALMNYKRAYFGVLCRMMLSGLSRQYPDEKKYLLAHVKKYKGDLLDGQMSLSRKLILRLAVFNYPFAEWIMKLSARCGIISSDMG